MKYGNQDQMEIKECSYSVVLKGKDSSNASIQSPPHLSAPWHLTSLKAISSGKQAAIAMIQVATMRTKHGFGLKNGERRGSVRISLEILNELWNNSLTMWEGMWWRNWKTVVSEPRHPQVDTATIFSTEQTEINSSHYFTCSSVDSNLL